MRSNQFSIIVETGFQLGQGESACPGVGRLTDTEIESASRIRHARYYGRAACLAAATASRLHKRLPNAPQSLGILCNGGPWNLQSSWNFITRAREAGPSFVNPLQFPSTLVSATATTSAAATGAHAFAYIVGHDHFAFFEVLRRATQAIRHGLADQVFAIGISTGGKHIARAARGAQLSEPLDVALGFAVGSDRQTSGRYLLEAGTDEGRIANYPSAQFYEAYLYDGHMSFCVPTPLANGEALGATGAVLIAAAARHHESLLVDERSRDFVVTLRKGKKFAMAVLRSSE